MLLCGTWFCCIFFQLKKKRNFLQSLMDFSQFISRGVEYIYFNVDLMFLLFPKESTRCLKKYLLKEKEEKNPRYLDMSLFSKQYVNIIYTSVHIPQ